MTNYQLPKDISMKSEVFKILDADNNPLFDYEVICKRLCNRFEIPKSKWRQFYGRVRYHISKMEDQHFLYVHRVNNGGTVFMLKSRATEGHGGEIPF